MPVGPVNQDQFYWAIIWVIPDRLVWKDLFRWKVGPKVWIHDEKNEMAGHTSYEANPYYSELMLRHLVLFTSF